MSDLKELIAHYKANDARRALENTDVTALVLHFDAPRARWCLMEHAEDARGPIARWHATFFDRRAAEAGSPAIASRLGKVALDSEPLASFMREDETIKAVWV